MSNLKEQKDILNYLSSNINNHNINKIYNLIVNNQYSIEINILLKYDLTINMKKTYFYCYRRDTNNIIILYLKDIDEIKNSNYNNPDILDIITKSSIKITDIINITDINTYESIINKLKSKQRFYKNKNKNSRYKDIINILEQKINELTIQNIKSGNTIQGNGIQSLIIERTEENQLREQRLIKNIQYIRERTEKIEQIEQNLTKIIERLNQEKLKLQNQQEGLQEQQQQQIQEQTELQYELKKRKEIHSKIQDKKEKI